MRILHVSTYFLPNYGGIEQVAFDICKCAPLNFEQKIICFNDKNKVEVDCFDNFEVHRIGTSLKLFSQSISLKYFFHLKKLIKNYSPDFIHFHAPNPLISIYLLLLLKNSKSKFFVHWHSDIIRQKKLHKFYKYFENKMLNKADKIIATSKNYILGSKILTSFKEKTLVIPNVVSDNFINNLEKINNVSKKENEVFFIGVHRKYKGLHYLLEVAKQLPNVIFNIAGSGPETAKLKKIKEIYDLNNVNFIGKINDELKCKFFMSSNLFVFPSCQKSEAFGIAMAEAMACRLPVISFEIYGSGVSWVNKNNVTGFCIEDFSIDNFAKKIKLLMMDKDLCKSIGENGYNHVKDNMSYKLLKKKLKDLYK